MMALKHSNFSKIVILTSRPYNVTVQAELRHSNYATFRTCKLRFADFFGRLPLSYVILLAQPQIQQG